VRSTTSSSSNDRRQDVDLAAAQIAFAEADRRLHRHEAEELQEVVLHDVLQRPDMVAVDAAVEAVEGGGRPSPIIPMSSSARYPSRRCTR